MIIPIEVGELAIRTDNGRVLLIAHHVEGEKVVNVMLSLSPLAAHNLGAVLPDYSEQAANEIIYRTVDEVMNKFRRQDND